MSRILFVDYDETLHDTYSKFWLRLDGIYNRPAREIMDAYLTVHRGIVHLQYPERHDDFFFQQRLVAEHLGIPYDEAEAREMARRFKEAQETTWTSPKFFPDALPFLDRAEERHVLCLTTGDFAREKADAIERASGRSHFSYIFDHTHLGIKGSSAYFQNALMSTESLAEEAIVIGDSLEHDIAAARGAGIVSIWVNRRGHLKIADSPDPDFEVKDLFEALAILDSL
jgi:putative hydrolase of the HAD superfamily